MTIRQATELDLPSIQALQQQIELEDTLWGFEADGIDEWDTRDLKWTLAAFEYEHLVGFIYCEPRPFEGECVFNEQSQILEIVELCVSKQYRHRRFGRGGYTRLGKSATPSRPRRWQYPAQPVSHPLLF